MKSECNVARDLMPLCIDGVASEESERYVQTHIEECTPCKKYFEGMKTALPAQAEKREAEEQAEFSRAAEKLKKKQRRRVWRNVVIGGLAGVIVVIGLYIGWTELAVKYNAELPTDAYGVSLAQLADGRIVVSIDYQGSKRIMGTVIHSGLEGDSDHPDGLYSLRIWMETTILPQTMATKQRNGPATVLRDSKQYDVIKIGEHGDTILWQKGDPIPQASEEMEAFYAADEVQWDHYVLCSQQVNDGEMDMVPQSAIVTQVSMTEQKEQLQLAVPEWQ